ncbi:hypothetical protein OTSGILL_0996 [Orientia tsutsugamushi str. Gilliam]|uniref:Uncharacterized protein n=1 Tax=Orientia tsutsugamushi str. Gilliam TaxID=1359184 RepID=A0A0F3MEY0_ORITS|nr:hypothetical protein OTSGILL_0996 [Orientia tsutsugamushi str. Gilliam]SPR04133.1 Uncharacterised protein [Orientia tsutsugamushi str. Gilliam]
MKFGHIKDLKDEKFRRLTKSKEVDIFKDGGYFEES